METEAILIGESLKCECGNSIWVSDIIEDISSELDVSFNTSEEQTDTVICEECEKEYELTLEMSISVEIEGYDIKRVKNHHTDYFDKNNNLIESSYFETLKIGDQTPLLLDGDYVHDDSLYQINKGEVLFIFSNKTDPNQIDMFALGSKV